MRHYQKTIPAGILFLLLLLPFHAAFAQDLESFEEKVTEFTLDNGLHFIIIERHVAPVASFVTFVDVGGANEPVGNTGIAHIFEHMAFKGTHYIGTTDWESEKKAIEEVEEAYQAWLREKRSTDADPEKVEQLWEDFEKAQEKSKEYVENNEFSQIIQNNGGVGLNAFTSSDATGYFYSLPQNRAELWFNLEADRFKNPVFREFYVEKNVVMEERRMRTDSNPVGRLIEEFLAVAYTAHPYGNPVVGWPSDIESTTITDAEKFYDDFYVPGNITIAIAGDVDPDEMKKLATQYFGDMPAGDPVPKLNTIEPEQRGERRFIMEEESQPFLLTGYHTVDQMHEDAAALQLLGSIISQGRTSILYKKLVEDEKLALAVQAFNGFPGTKYQSMFLTFAVPNQGIDIEEVEKAILDEIEAVKNGSITQEELDRAITNARANLVRGLASNNGLALRFAQTYAQQGDWRKVFTSIDELQSVTLDDLQRVANEYLTQQNRTVGMIVNKQAQQEVADAQENQ
jgi:predicted Zn-dependent peptidase